MPSTSPLGFTPAEISSLINSEIVQKHADEAAFLWSIRRRAVSEPHYSLKDLVRLDDRVEAHLSGLFVTPDVAWKTCELKLDEHEAGSIFAAAVLAFGQGHRENMRNVLVAGTATPDATTGLVSALGWLDYTSVEPWVARLLDANQPHYRAVGVACCGIHRIDPGAVLDLAVRDPDPRLRAQTLRAIGLLRRRDLVDEVRNCLRDQDEVCRFWAAWALTLQGEASSLVSLNHWMETESQYTDRAMQLALRSMNIREGREWISSLSQETSRVRAAVVAAGVVGDPETIPWLIRRMRSPETARLAGESFSMITGVDLAFDDLDQDGPAPIENATLEEVLNQDDQANLRWPSVERIQRWWDKHSSRFTPGIRHLAGRPVTEQQAVNVLLRGKQRQRIAAAIELALLRPGEKFFEVRARGVRQERELNAWSS